MAFAGFPPSEKLLLIRKLIEERMKDSLFARWFGDNLNHLDDVALMGSPEATIVTIVETYHVLREQGVSAASALSAIEEHRSIRSPRASQIGSDLEAYVRKRVRLEHSSGKQLSDRDISRACFLANAFAERHISQEREPTQAASAEHIPDQPTGASEKHKPDISRPFALAAPDPGSKVLASFTDRARGRRLFYYEHPKTFGEARGFVSPYEYPQVALVLTEKEDPILIVRSEQDSSGTLFLCSLDAKGTHTNWGPTSPMSLDDFVKQVIKIETKIKNETASVAPKEDEVSTLGRAAASGIEDSRDWTQIKSIALEEDGAAASGGGQIGSDLEKHISQERERTPAASEEHIPDQPAGASEEHELDVGFMAALPNSGSQMLARWEHREGYKLGYFEHPKMLGEARGFVSPYEYPQVIVVFNEKDDPILIVRSEQNPSGTLFLCSLDAKGTHTNWGPISPMSRDDFAKEANKIVMQINHDTVTRAQERRRSSEMASQIASTIDSYIDTAGFKDFETDAHRMFLIVTDEDAISISASERFARGNVLVSVPLKELGISRRAIEEGGPLRHTAVHVAAQEVMQRLEMRSQSSSPSLFAS
jgi:hypothetical protein